MVDARMVRAAAVLRAASVDGVAADRELVASLLERMAPLAVWWHEPYAAPWVPVIEAATRVAVQVVGDEEQLRADRG